MDADAAGSARVKVESELVRVQNALPIEEEARRKVEGGRRNTWLSVRSTNESLCF